MKFPGGAGPKPSFQITMTLEINKGNTMLIDHVNDDVTRMFTDTIYTTIS